MAMRLAIVFFFFWDRLHLIAQPGQMIGMEWLMFVNDWILAVLTLYLRDILLFDENVSTVLYHVFVMLCYFTPVFGAILADTYLGKFK